MGPEENARLVRRGYEAFSSGDMATLAGLFAAGAVWHVPGNGTLSGAKEGRDAILAHFGELFARSGGTLKVTLHDVIGGDEHTIGLQRVYARREHAVIDQNGANVFHLRDGVVSEVWELHEDTAASDAFWL